MNNFYELIYMTLDQVKFYTDKEIEQEKFRRSSLLFFLKECDDFSVWTESACAEELEMFAKSDKCFRAFVDMMGHRKKNMDMTAKPKKNKFEMSYKYTIGNLGS
jgi:hypothetical protein